MGMHGMIYSPGQGYSPALPQETLRRLHDSEMKSSTVTILLTGYYYRQGMERTVEQL